MRKASVVLYQYDELNEQAKKVAREWFKNDDGEMGQNYCDEECSSWNAVLKDDYGFGNPDICYSGFCCPGDGASFTCESVDLQKLVAVFPEKFSAFRRLYLDIISKNVRFFIKRKGSCYCHERMVRCDYEGYRWLSEKLEGYVSKIAAVIDGIQQSLSRKIYKDLEEAYFQAYSDENAEECIVCNEYEFYSDGHRADFRL